ncbi:hypothetical protein [Streptomyces spinosus]|uniref:hypothetical protein n=1 Tax=Streptomyces spinosus TaxID=2872623 RepID=UPI001CECCC93|nr:hypothetical protein [Streptomyces spinosus]
MNQPDLKAADVLVAEARRAVHESLTLFSAWEADRVRSLIADLETAVEARTAMRFTEPVPQPVVTVHAAPDLSPAASEALEALVDVARSQIVCEFEHPHPEHPCGQRITEPAAQSPADPTAVRAETLREAIDMAETLAANMLDVNADRGNGAYDVVDLLRRLAGEQHTNSEAPCTLAAAHEPHEWLPFPGSGLVHKGVVRCSGRGRDTAPPSA